MRSIIGLLLHEVVDDFDRRFFKPLAVQSQCLDGTMQGELECPLWGRMRLNSSSSCGGCIVVLRIVLLA